MKYVVAYIVVGVLIAGMYSAGFREHNSRYPRGYQLVVATVFWPIVAVGTTGYELVGNETLYEYKKED